MPTFRWEQLARRQKIYIAAAVVLVIVVISGLAFDSFRSWQQVRVYERQAIEAERQKDEALATASKIATEIKVREEELTKVEGKRDAKKEEVKRAADDVSRDRAEYDAAVKRRRPDAPSSDELCRQLAAVGHPCYPR